MAIRVAAVLLVFFSVLYLLYRVFIYSPVIFGLRDDFKEAVPFQAVPAGIAGIRAVDCGSCHREIYEEWKSSYHAKSFADPFFQAFWRKDKFIWICLNCHAPLVNQQPFLVKGIEGGSVTRPIKEPNPDYDGEFQREGISCAACHLRDGVILGPYEDSDAPHPTKYDPRFRTTEICYTCHQVPGGPFQFYNGGPCATYFEFEGNPWAQKGYICQTCHMPEVVRAVATGGPQRKSGRHLWQGGHFPEMVKRALKVKVRGDKNIYSPGETARFTLTLENTGAGHRIPTGDPDRFFTVSFRVVDGKDHILKEKTHSIGRWILWKPLIVEVYENRPAPFESLSYGFDYRIPSDGEGLRLITEVAYYIMSERTHGKLEKKYGLIAKDPYRSVIFRETVPLKGS